MRKMAKNRDQINNMDHKLTGASLAARIELDMLRQRHEDDFESYVFNITV